MDVQKIYVQPDPVASISAAEYRKRYLTKKVSKYHNKKTVIDDISFMSKREADYYSALKMLMAAGQIADLKLQPRFPIGLDGHKICVVIADFSYWEKDRFIVIDVKGCWTPVSRLKWKLAQAFYPGYDWRIVK